MEVNNFILKKKSYTIEPVVLFANAWKVIVKTPITLSRFRASNNHECWWVITWQKLSRTKKTNKSKIQHFNHHCDVKELSNRARSNSYKCWTEIVDARCMLGACWTDIVVMSSTFATQLLTCQTPFLLGENRRVTLTKGSFT